MKGQQYRMSYEKQSNKRQQQWLLKVIVVFAISAGIFFGINSMGSAATDSTQETNAKSVNATQTVNTKNNTTQS